MKPRQGRVLGAGCRQPIAGCGEAVPVPEQCTSRHRDLSDRERNQIISVGTEAPKCSPPFTLAFAISPAKGAGERCERQLSTHQHVLCVCFHAESSPELHQKQEERMFDDASAARAACPSREVWRGARCRDRMTSPCSYGFSTLLLSS
ncbi:hypothetical protein Anapl_11629 [Anas platyrhynchos]|uniref:Uncharacterized protein n=1 Tax=Anas platyrhynchos TaxID=8839 RepID=R0JLK3_ANAPL|nr:hypothetical protein Anapl_11629 [Anas platyrhynchos]